MGAKTNISWTHTFHPDGTSTKGASWNPVSGCTKLTAECKFCYVDRDWHRLTHLPAYAGRKFTDVACHPDRLEMPLQWQRPRRIFVCSTSDLFHADIPDEFLDRIFAVISLCPQHTFLILTKRADRMQQYLSAPCRRQSIALAANRFSARHPIDWVRANTTSVERNGDPDEGAEWLPRWPLPNVHAGVTAGTQETANERIPLLMQTPAAKHWVSMEPLLGPVDLLATPAGDILCRCEGCLEMTPDTRLDWVVCGGESGSRKQARPMHPQWARNLRDQCVANKVPFFFKQQGAWIPGQDATNEQMNDPKTWGCWVNIEDGKSHDGNSREAFRDGDFHMLYVRDGGDLLDDREHKEMPQ